MKRLCAGALLLTAGLLTASTAPADLATTKAARFWPIVVQPPQLQALLQKMAQLQINSERFSRVARGFVLGSPTHVRSGQPEHLVRTSIDETELGEGSLSPAEGEVFVGSVHRPMLIAIGSTLYQFGAVGSHGRRQWVRSRNPDPSPAALILPFHGGGVLEVDAGGTGAYAGLVNLLTTAVGPASVDGPASVEGQRTTEFTATVEPRFLIKHLTVEDVANFRKEPLNQKLQLFLTESGLPVRAVETTRSRYYTASVVTEILAVNVPVTVRPPPARQTTAISRGRRGHPTSKQ